MKIVKYLDGEELPYAEDGGSTKRNSVRDNKPTDCKKFQRILREKQHEQISADRETYQEISRREIGIKYKGLIKMVEASLKKQLKDVQLKAVLKSQFFNPMLSECVGDIRA
jgi:HSP90 family molecular chaperone